MSIFIENGTIINEGLSFKGSLFVENGIICAITEDPSDFPQLRKRANEVIDASGMLILPGVIDDQVHFREPGAEYKGSIATESAAAVLGGVTSYMDMPNNNPPICSQELLARKFEKAAQDSLANYSFYIGASNDNISELLATDPHNVCGIKVFMGSSTGNMLVDNPETLEAIFSQVPVLIATHCEEESIILANTAAARERFGNEIPIAIHPQIRSREACIASTRKAIDLALKYSSRLHILHISTAEEVELLHKAREQSDRITGEVCVHHLWFSDCDYEQYGSLIKCNPAIKSSSDREALRQAARQGVISVVATDHAPHLLSEKETPYLQSPSGIPLVQHSLRAMLELSCKGVFTLTDVVRLMCHAPADCFKISHRGYLREGYFADITIVNPNKPSDATPAYRCGWTPFTRFSSTIVHTLVNGVPVVRNSQLTGLNSSLPLSFDD
ncbi:MAG: dihydroorotase [Bacteroidales bacterium]|jgi:dihydroorotase|nr:dihydroorotase [Bacteroidales bacterium]